MELAAYKTQTRRKRLTGAYSDKSPVKAILPLYEDTQIALYASDGRCLIFSTAQIAVKTTRATQGVAVLFASSDLPEVLGVADRIVVMREGEIAGELLHEQADERQALSLAMPKVSQAVA